MAGKPKPTNLKILEGNRGRRKLVDEPKPRPLIPTPPKGLDRVAKKFWLELAPKIESLGLLTEVDVSAFTALCQVWSRLTQIWQDIKRTQADVNAKNEEIETLQKLAFDIKNMGSVGKKTTELKALKKELLVLMREERHYMQTLRHQSAEFGLTPRGRAGLTVRGHGEDDGGDLLS